MPSDLLARHQNLSSELAQAIRERATLQTAVARAFSETWRLTAHLGVTERRETCKDAAADMEVEVLKLSGEVEALRVELHSLDVVIKYSDHHDGHSTGHST